ncbi:SH3 domain-containing C40 family peptidase [Paenibacillus sp.]|uniref:C40 family peptidase n=1 Tax=Paenibacillus sp. TaxID=58172 RepID=UPI002D732419|nr:SH3 domain-containing C40 family peptidase [Paenibacillus sp.]HZG56529.1 SH3 domain-containing C40 family peptidase [Paenibacillus sp.]
MTRKQMLAATLAGALLVGSAPVVFPSAASAAWTGEIESSVSFRTGPSTGDDRIRYLKAGETVTIIEKVNAYWFKVKDKSGTVGYTSAGSKYISVSGSPDAPASSGAGTGVIVASVSLREAPSTTADRIRYVAKGEKVAILDKPNSYWYQVKDAKGNVGYVSTSAKYISASYQAPSAPVGTPSEPEDTGVIVSSVSLRSGPSATTTRIRYVAKGETVSILGKPSEYWYNVKDKYGNVGYVSASERYIDANYTPPVIAPADVPAAVQRVIDAGKRYLGTPYEFGSDRSSTSTFDCSDFVRTAFREGAGIQLPSDSRSQGEYVKNIGRVTTDWRALKPGDILFFMSYEGSSPSDYDDVDKSEETITHDAIYLGNGQIMHTYSKDSGGVRIDTMGDDHWEYRFLFGGSAM